MAQSGFRHGLCWYSVGNPIALDENAEVLRQGPSATILHMQLDGATGRRNL